jgi:hypothetical protein
VKTNEYVDRYKASLPPSPPDAIWLAQCNCIHWDRDHCPHCGHCNECDCEGFLGG